MTAEISETDGSTSKDILSIRNKLKSIGIHSHQVIRNWKIKMMIRKRKENGVKIGKRGRRRIRTKTTMTILVGLPGQSPRNPKSQLNLGAN